jgi:cation:H+ antiporter
MPLWNAILFLVLGALGIALGGELVVVGSKNLAVIRATAIGIESDLAEKIVGLTIVAVGTSLPELVTSVIAAKKGQVEMALGNVIGANLFNIFFVLVSATINPIVSDSTIFFDLVFMMTTTLLLFGLSFTGKLKRWMGLLFLGLYIAYLVYLVLRVVLAAKGIWLP